MTSVRTVVIARNLLVGAGAYFVWNWLDYPLALALDRLTRGLRYAGDFNQAVVMPLVAHFPEAVAGAGVGATVVWLAESERPECWALFPAALYVVLGFVGYHWARPPEFLDRVAQTIGVVFPAMACAIGALWAKSRGLTHLPTDSAPG
jgi:hypothetical protein